MDNDSAIKHRQTLSKINNFNILELRKMPQYFGWVEYSVNIKNKIFLFLGGNDDGVALRCFWNSHYEKKTLEIWACLSCTDGIILDIGSHTGIYSLVAKNSIKNGAVISFEPHFLNFSRLNLNFRANKFSTNTLFMNAVGEKNEILSFSVDSNFNFLSSGGKIGKVNNMSTTKIKTFAMDSFLDDQAKTNVKLIKIDVEGHEYKVFLGMKNIILKSQPVLFFECISDKDSTQIYSFLCSNNYRIFIVDDIENSINETYEVLPIFDNANKLVHQKINRIAVPNSNIDLLNQFI